MTAAEHDEAIARGLCKSRGTGQCAALCLSHMSVHTTNGQCPEARSIWHREIASIRAQLAVRGLAIVPVETLKEADRLLFGASLLQDPEGASRVLRAALAKLGEIV